MELVKIFVVLGCLWGQTYSAATKPMKAFALLNVGDDPTVKGNITFTQASCTEPVHVTIEMEGLTPGSHGFHIHELGNLSGGCVSAGAHFNPEGYAHGGKNADVRHVGDLGNVIANEKGVVFDTFSDNLISLAGKNSILGRTVVTHALPDDNGLGGDLESTKTGNAGARLVCGVIGTAEAIMDLCGAATTAQLLPTVFLAAGAFITQFNRLF